MDPICTFIFSVLVLGTTYTVVRDGLHILMEGNCDFVSNAVSVCLSGSKLLCRDTKRAEL